jgi:sulfate/thiosulfate transport system substrate-binding protein
MRFRSGVVLLALSSVVALSCKSGDSAGSASGTRLTLAANSVSRPLFEKGLIPAFKAKYAKDHPGFKVEFTESYEGSGAQQRAIAAGLKADIAALSLAPEIDKLAEAGLASKDWNKDANQGVPATSMVVLVVRKGNPKGIKDWNDLTRDDLQVILPNPDTSGAAQWNVVAMSGYADIAMNNVDEAVVSFLEKVRSHVAAFGKSGKEAQQIFSSGKGDVIVGWECEALERMAAGDQIEIVYPSTTIQMEPPVAVITPKGRTTNAAATEFVQWLSSTEAQKIYMENHYRPKDASLLAATTYPAVKNLLTIDKLGGWEAVQKRLFGPDGLWNKAAQG